MSEDLMSIKIISFEVAKVEGEWSKVTKRWRDVSDLCKGVSNCFWETWLVWHVENKSREKLKKWLDDRKELGVKAAGKCPVDPLSKELNSLIGKTCKEAFPEIHSRVRTLILNTLVKDLKKHKAAKGNLPGHSAILLHHQSIPSSTRPHPIPFDKQNVRIVPPKERKDNFRLEMRVSRGGDRKVTPPDVVTLRCQGRRVQSQVAILKKIASEEYSFRGSKLVYAESKKKWFVQLAYRRPIVAKPELDESKTVVLLARKNHPWTLISPEGRKMPGGRGKYIIPIRKSLIMERLNRNANYRNAGGANKGHGYNRATRDQWKLKQKWKEFTKRATYGYVNEVVEWCIATGCGRAVYIQPEGDMANTRFLSTAGKVENKNDSTGWPWFDVGTKLKQKCQENGIECVILKPLKVRKNGNKSTKKVTKKRVTSDVV